jgi:hypothetical protein
MQDGHLDLDEFVVCMHLILIAQDGQPLPERLPQSWVHPSKRSSVAGSSSGPSASGPPRTSVVGPVPLPAQPPMAIPVMAVPLGSLAAHPAPGRPY